MSEPAGGPCEVDYCEHLAMECHSGKIYLCGEHYAEAAAVVGHGVMSVSDWLSAKNA